uniref:Uncharacterized protein n=1 Tax=Oryza glumipatula TaxID=40148 RepID=A0A0D9ZBL0_9ORYZ
MCSGVPELCLSSAEEHARLRRIIFEEILSLIPMVWLTRDQDANARELPHSGVAVCPEGTTCREPFLLRFSALFTKLGRSLHAHLTPSKITGQQETETMSDKDDIIKEQWLTTRAQK